MRVIWLDRALDDLEAIEQFIGQDNLRAAREVEQQIKTSVRRLQDQPRMGRPGRVAGTRELVIPGLPYIAAYSINESTVYVLAIVHGAREWPESF